MFVQRNSSFGHLSQHFIGHDISRIFSFIYSREYKELREVISKLNNLGENKHADWITSVLLLSDKTVPVDNKVISPGEYLKKGVVFNQFIVAFSNHNTTL